MTEKKGGKKNVTQQHQVSVLAGEDSGEEEVFPRPGRPAEHGSLHVQNHTFNLSD